MEDPVQALHDGLSPTEFEGLLNMLMQNMGFESVDRTGGSGDKGIDLKATWTQTQVPGLRVDLDFIIQAKRLDPKQSLNPNYVRQLRGSLKGGQWGLLITTARVSPQTREEGLGDPSRIVSVIDGKQLVELCQRYGVAFRTEYRFDKSFLKKEVVKDELVEARPASRVPSDLTEILSKSIGEVLQRVGRTSIYKGRNMAVIARWSQRYAKKGQNYWYGMTQRDISSVEEYGVTHFAYVCGTSGVVLIPSSLMKQMIEAGKLGFTSQGGEVRHYHIIFGGENNHYTWNLRSGERRDVDEFFYKAS